MLNRNRVWTNIYDIGVTDKVIVMTFEVQGMLHLF